MNERPAVLFGSVALACLAAGILYVSRRQRASTALLHHIHECAQRSANSSQASYRLLKKQRRVLSALSHYILPVSEGVEKQAS